MSWYASSVSQYWWLLGSHKLSPEYKKNTEFDPNQILFKNISTSYLTFEPQKSVKFSLKKMPKIK